MWTRCVINTFVLIHLVRLCLINIPDTLIAKTVSNTCDSVRHLVWIERVATMCWFSGCPDTSPFMLANLFSGNHTASSYSSAQCTMQKSSTQSSGVMSIGSTPADHCADDQYFQ